MRMVWKRKFTIDGARARTLGVLSWLDRPFIMTTAMLFVVQSVHGTSHASQEKYMVDDQRKNEAWYTASGVWAGVGEAVDHAAQCKESTQDTGAGGIDEVGKRVDGGDEHGQGLERVLLRAEDPLKVFIAGGAWGQDAVSASRPAHCGDLP